MLYKFKAFTRFFLSLVFVATVVIAGSVGYVVIEGWSWIEVFYMTVITVSTVGFKEVQPLSEIDNACKLFVLGTSDQICSLKRMINYAQPKS